jgi:hypothetical protein
LFKFKLKLWRNQVKTKINFQLGAATFSIMTLSIMTLSTMTLSI